MTNYTVGQKLFQAYVTYDARVCVSSYTVTAVGKRIKLVCDGSVSYQLASEHTLENNYRSTKTGAVELATARAQKAADEANAKLAALKAWRIADAPVPAVAIAEVL